MIEQTFEQIQKECERNLNKELTIRPIGPFFVLWFCEDGNGFEEFSTLEEAEKWTFTTVHECVIVHADKYFVEEE